MNRWFGLSASISALALVSVFGCTPPAETDNSKTPMDGSNESPKGETKDAASTNGGEGAQTDPKATTALPDKPKDGDDVAVLETSAGKIVVMFYPDKAPRHVENFKNLAKNGFYDGTRFHRCIPGFMIQGGDPLSKDLTKSAMWGTGGNMGPDKKEINVPAEFNDVRHKRGVLSMARSQSPDSASSQFFIMVQDNEGLDGQYSAFGATVSGMDVADKIVAIGDAQNNGAVDPKKAFMLKSVKITKWPVK